MAIRNEFVEREWLLRHLGHTIGTHNVDHIINFARDAGYLDADGCVTVLGKNFYRVASRDPDALIAKLNPAPGACRMAVLMPITWPEALISGPPLLPGFTAASVWM